MNLTASTAAAAAAATAAAAAVSRSVFEVERKLHAGHMKAVKQSVLDGTSKWSAKLAIRGSSLLDCTVLLRTINLAFTLNTYRLTSETRLC